MNDYNSRSITAAKSKAFAIRIIRLCKILREERKEYILSNQLMRSGTSIGANIKEALRGQSDSDFGAKMNIALKEASETEYWLELMAETEIISQYEFQSLIEDCTELIRILTSTVRTVFSKKTKPQHF